MVSEVRLGTAAGRWVVAATVLGSGMAMLDATVVNIALPAIADELDAGLSGLQWTLDGYLLTLASLILLGGSLADRFGRRRIFIVGTVWFALASLMCALAPTVSMLGAARALQGIGAALLTPVSLAILQTGLAPSDRARGIALWSGLAGVSTAIGPVVGGWLIDVASWRWIFAINLPIAAVVVAIALRYVPESRESVAPGRLDLTGAALGVGSLAGLTYGFIRWGEDGFDAVVGAALAAGAGGLAAFVLAELRQRRPMLPPRLFASRAFTGANLVTLGLYGALTAALFLLVVRLQDALDYSPLQAGMATVPITLLMLAGSDLAGQTAARIGPRLPLTVGPLVAGAGLALLGGVGPGDSYWTGVLPGVVVFGLGLTVVVAPLTATVLAAADDELAGIASGVNNAIARTGGLLGVAVVPLLAGGASGAAFRTAIWITAGLAAAAGVVGWLSLAGRRRAPEAARPTPPGPAAPPSPTPAETTLLGHAPPGAASPGSEPAGTAQAAAPHEYCCGADAPPMRPART
ncbi:MAG: DHA2 family efflux MFS transporter permease subunit [Micromonosporaceae bacterium]|nr:DHA2 family efflux MFS transporter permease subunit [Micromonosporaceae bacterium]